LAEVVLTGGPRPNRPGGNRETPNGEAYLEPTCDGMGLYENLAEKTWKT